jgi:hypothetical protein
VAGPRFPSPRDAETLARFGRELYAKAFRRVSVRPYRPGPRTEEDVAYGEAPFKDWPEALAYETPCLVAVMPGWQTKLTPWGIDQERPLTIHFNPDIILADGHPLPGIGDHLVMQNDRYRIEQVNPSDWFGNTDRTFTHVAMVRRYRPTTVSPYTSRAGLEEE